MNGIEKITQRIDEDTQKEIRKVLDAAQEKSTEILTAYRKQAEEEAAAGQRRKEKLAAEREERLVSVAQMESRKVLLSAKQEMVDRAFELALDRLCSLPDEDYIRTVAGLLAEAAPDGRGSVLFSSKDRERIGQAAVDAANRKLGEKGQLQLSDQTRNIRGGFILSNGRIEVNGTFETLVRLQREEMAGEVAKLLFPEN